MWLGNVKKGYIGVKNIARKIKKGYIGVGGIARQFFSSEKQLVYYGKISDLQIHRSSLAATSVGNYALFGGGRSYVNTSSVTGRSNVDVYSIDLVYSTPTSLDKTEYFTAVSIGNYALFGGGGSSTPYNTVNTYTSNLVKGTASKLSTARNQMAATSVGNYALFGGGIYGSVGEDVVDTYTSDLVKGTASKLSKYRYNLAATSIGNYALFGGGASAKTTLYNTVDTYTSDLVKSTTSNLSVARCDLAATSIGDYALFSGGANQYNSSSATPYDTVDTYTSNLVKGTASNLSVARGYLAATTIEKYALFGGGINNSTSTLYNTVDTYTSDLVKGTTNNLSENKRQLAATSIGDYALFGGGRNAEQSFATVDVYQVV